MTDRDDWKGEGLIRTNREKQKREIARLNRAIANRRRHAEERRAREAAKTERRDG